ncbi:MAG TPA: class I fructose-bisphosphate aldolase [Opitutaceae bacterium]|nr:class I fructose-bisphosphate aldolase [Opitutaceae bacterium]
MSPKDLAATARVLVAAGKGILAADESNPTIEQRLRGIGVPSSEQARHDYREMLLTTPRLGEYISGVILFDETLRQKTADGTRFVEVLQRQNILPGIKVDAGAKPLAGFEGDKITEGLDSLRARLAEYARLGARFTKWRAVFTIGPDIPSHPCIAANAHALARFAALSQEAGLVPIVEPEVLMDGDHPIERHGAVTVDAQRAVFSALAEHRVRLDGMLLKPNMILPGTNSPEAASVGDVATETLRCLKLAVPAAVPGIVFLSGGQSDIRATEHLDALNRLGSAPWELSFSFGRALQAPALKMWAGKKENVAAAQKALLHRAACNSAARRGAYTADVERRA